jgi:hypothetical protein
MCSGCCERGEFTFSDEGIDAFLLKKFRRGTGCKESHVFPSTVSIPLLPRHTPPSPVPEVVEAIFYSTTTHKTCQTRPLLVLKIKAWFKNQGFWNCSSAEFKSQSEHFCS